MALDYLWLVPALPLAGALALLVSAGRLPDKVVAWVGAGSVGLAAAVALWVGRAFLEGGAPHYAQTLWTWMSVGGFAPRITLYLDPLALVMMGVITGVGFLIHLYATGYMWKDHEEPKGYSRFFAYMNLFVFAMLLLVLGDNLLVLFFGWEGVGLCSYLLIGFYHRDPANGYAARKAFVVTRVGDTALALGLFLLFWEVGTLHIQDALGQAAALDGALATIICLLLLGGAVGKSAQLPLQTWLPDAMAGPTPVSALIHAATMVTAGVYLIARMQGLYLQSPDAQHVVAAVGLATLLISSVSALAQSDIKRILAYSTMSQIGYMFMALGVGAWSAAIFHLMTHAFFKALLFLAAGSVILAMNHEQDIHRMGGLRRKLPVPFWCMAIGSAGLVAFPFTSGFYSKDAILLTAWANAGWLYWGGGVLAAALTALYTTRMMIVTFWGEAKAEPHDATHAGFARANMWLPLLALCTLAIGGGWFGIGVLDDLLGALAAVDHTSPVALATILLPLGAIALGWVIFTDRIDFTAISESARGRRLQRFLAGGWGFDWFYDRLLTRPFVWLVKVNKGDCVDWIYRIASGIVRAAHYTAALTQTGRLRWYAANFGVGALVVLLIVTGWL